MTRSDEELFRSFVDPSPVSPVPGFYIDFLGRKTRLRTFAPVSAHLDGTVSKKLPIPDDGFLAGATEYLGLFSAIESCRRGAFVAVELGAAWGPWICAAALAAKRRGISQVDLIAIEGSAPKVEFMKQHLRDNDVLGHNGVAVNIKRGVVWTKTGTAQFPLVDPATDHGGAARDSEGGPDYRGFHLEHETVPAYSLPDLLADSRVVDFLHIDIQGAEAEVCKSSAAFLAERVRYIVIGTHSRRIEGDVIETLMTSGFKLLREHPCYFSLENPWPGSFEGLTHTDGVQLWMNQNDPG